MKPNEMSDRQFLGWNTQVRQQLVSDLYDVCQQNGEILEELLDEYVYLLKDNKNGGLLHTSVNYNVTDKND